MITTHVNLKQRLMKAMRDYIVLELSTTKYGSDNQKANEITDLYLELAKAEVIAHSQTYTLPVTQVAPTLNPNIAAQEVFNPYATSMQGGQDQLRNNAQGIT